MMTSAAQLDAWYRRRTEDIEAEKQARRYAEWAALSQPVIERLSESVGPKRTYPRLRGEPGIPAMVAGTVNKITSGPNTSARMRLPKIGDISVDRGPGNDLKVGAGLIGGSATLDPPQPSRGVSVSNVRGPRFNPLQLPKEARIFNGPDGRLYYELPPGSYMGGAFKGGRFLIE